MLTLSFLGLCFSVWTTRAANRALQYFGWVLCARTWASAVTWYYRSPGTFGLRAMAFLSLAHWTGAHGLLPSTCSRPGLGRKERWKVKPCCSRQGTRASAHRWPVAADKPGCQKWWILAPLDAEWRLPDTGDRQALRGRRQVPSTFRWPCSTLPILLTLLMPQASGLGDMRLPSCLFMLLVGD